MKKVLSLVLCVGLLSLGACSSEKKQKPEQSVDSSSEDERARKDVETVTKVAENDAPESEQRKESGKSA